MQGSTTPSTMFLSACPCLGAVLVAALAATAAPPHSSTWSEGKRGAQALRQHVTAAIAAQRLQAAGTWYAEDGKAVGVWRLLPRLRQAGLDTWCATLLWEEETAVADESGPAPGPVYVSVVGRLDRGGLSVSREPCPIDPLPVHAAPEPLAAAKHLVERAGGKLYGSLMDGELTLANGQRGRWQGWWHAWKANVPGVGLTDVESK